MKANKLTKETINTLGVESRNFPDFSIGDSIAVSQWITEGSKKRIQIFEGDVIAKHQNGASSTFTVRKIGANSVAVERIYPYYTPVIDSIAIVKRGKVRRAKLYYLRNRVGKKARIKELVLTKEQKSVLKEKEVARVTKVAEAVAPVQEKVQSSDKE
ncbi:50S ribosomal protein L19 [Candidatus Babeliales bacterium]|nr:50S ribosomal protein L19 [Candidatus Babeliales bacterium]